MWILQRLKLAWKILFAPQHVVDAIQDSIAIPEPKKPEIQHARPGQMFSDSYSG